MAGILESAPEELAARLGAAVVARAWIAPDENGRWVASHQLLAPLARFLEESPDQRGHEAVFLSVGPRSGALLGVFLQRLDRGQAQGGVRRQAYASLADFVSDGLRLAWGMGCKNALAGLWWSGGKGLIAETRKRSGQPDPERRRQRYLDFGDFVSSLDGCYVTAEDAGTLPEDVATIFLRTRFVTCIPEAFGGSGNPSRATARGVVCGIETALQTIGSEGIAGARVLVQGAGNVGAALVDQLLERDVGGVLVGETRAARLQELADRWDGAPVELRHTPPGDVSLLCEPCDVLAPCALGGVLGPASIAELKARVVCGSANNPLLDEARDAEALQARGIVYVPDYIVNRMGIVRCANEQAGRLHPDPATLRHLDPANPQGIPAVTLAVLRRAAAEGVATTVVAERMALRLCEQPHPLYGTRARAIVQALLHSAWHLGESHPAQRQA